MDVNFSKLWDIGKDRGDWRAAVCEVAKSWKRLSEWTCMRAKLLQSSLSLCNPMDCNPPGFSVFGDSPDKNTGVSCHALLGGIFPTQRLNPRLLCLLHWQHITLFNFLHSFLLSSEVMFAFIFYSHTEALCWILPSLMSVWKYSLLRYCCYLECWPKKQINLYTKFTMQIIQLCENK